MSKERDPEKERRITEKMERMAANERERADRFKLVEEDRLSAEASGSALRKDQSRYERYLYVPPHQRISQSDGQEEEETRPSTDNGYAPYHDDRARRGQSRGRGDGRRGRGSRGGRGGAPRGGRNESGREGRGGGGHRGGRNVNHHADREWRHERMQADTLRLDANRTEDGEWKRELDRGKEIPFASTRRSDDTYDKGPSGRLRQPPPRGGSASGRGRGQQHRRPNNQPDEGRHVRMEERNDLTVTVHNERAGPWGGRNQRSSPIENGGPLPQRTRRPTGRRGGRGRGRGRGQNIPNVENGEVRTENVPRDAIIPGRRENLTSSTNEENYDEIPDLATNEGDVEDEYIDDTLEDLEDLDQYRLKIDLNEFTVDNPDLPDPILKKPIEFSWARAVSEEERCQKNGEPVRQFSGSPDIVWQDEEEEEGELCDRVPLKSAKDAVHESMTITTVHEKSDDEEIFDVHGVDDCEEEAKENSQKEQSAPEIGEQNGNSELSASSIPEPNGDLEKNGDVSPNGGTFETKDTLDDQLDSKVSDDVLASDKSVAVTSECENSSKQLCNEESSVPTVVEE